MANRLKEFPAAQQRVTRRYPWDLWTDGTPWELVRGEDFEQSTNQFRNRMYQKAKTLGLKVRTMKRIVPASEDGQVLEREVLVVQFLGTNGDHPVVAA